MAESRELDQQVQGGKAVEAERASETKNPPVSETWAEETIADLDDFIESQGIYIRQ
jgi:hypothetical protein